MTCDNCFDTRHWKCHNECGCVLCYGAERNKPTSPRSEEYKKRVRDRTGERQRYYQSSLNPERARVKQAIGVRTHLTEAEVAKVFEAKVSGSSLSEMARELGYSRDRIRTVWNSPGAPESPPGAPKWQGTEPCRYCGKPRRHKTPLHCLRAASRPSQAQSDL